ncbi:MAG: hypothetical protein HDS14_08385 [Bacteroides sp.]|nr:hypothetical protein [Bacteroides sp.]
MTENQLIRDIFDMNYDDIVSQLEESIEIDGGIQDMMYESETMILEVEWKVDCRIHKYPETREAPAEMVVSNLETSAPMIHRGEYLDEVSEEWYELPHEILSELEERLEDPFLAQVELLCSD